MRTGVRIVSLCLSALFLLASSSQLRQAIHEKEDEERQQSLRSSSSPPPMGRNDRPCIGALLDISITFDQFAADISWILIEEQEELFGVNIVSYGGNYGGYFSGSTVETSVCLVDGCYSFVMNDSGGDGICCTYGNGSYTLSSSGITVATGGVFASQEDTDFCVVNGVATTTVSGTDPDTTGPPPTTETTTTSTTTTTTTDPPPTTTTTATTVEPNSANVVIVGAGAAGLAAAYTLIHHGIDDIVILEATTSLGGRAQKNETFTDFPIDLGPSFIKNPSAIRRIVEDDGIRLSEPPGTGLPVFVDWTYHDFLNDYIAPKDPSKVIYGCRVTEVNYDDPTGIVETKCGQERAFLSNHVIVTVPLPILKEGDILFTPFLPSSMTVNHPGWMWGGFKILLKFSSNFQSSFCFPDIPGAQGECINLDGESLFWDETAVHSPVEGGHTIIAGYILGLPSNDFTSLSDFGIEERVLDLLDERFNGQARLYFVDSFVENWTAKQDFRGTLSSWGYDKPDTGNPSGAQNILNRVWIAGEAFPVDGSNGWVDAGIFSGDDAAKQIVKLRRGVEDETWFWTKVAEDLGR